MPDPKSIREITVIERDIEPKNHNIDKEHITIDLVYRDRDYKNGFT